MAKVCFVKAAPRGLLGCVVPPGALMGLGEPPGIGLTLLEGFIHPHGGMGTARTGLSPAEVAPGMAPGCAGRPWRILHAVAQDVLLQQPQVFWLCHHLGCLRTCPATLMQPRSEAISGLAA